MQSYMTTFLKWTWSSISPTINFLYSIYEFHLMTFWGAKHRKVCATEQQYLGWLLIIAIMEFQLLILGCGLGKTLKTQLWELLYASHLLCCVSAEGIKCCYFYSSMTWGYILIKSTMPVIHMYNKIHQQGRWYEQTHIEQAVHKCDVCLLCLQSNLMHLTADTFYTDNACSANSKLFWTS